MCLSTFKKAAVVLATSLLISSISSANEQPSAESLVERAYLGGHGIYYSLDDDRWLNGNSQAELDSASGVGVEYGIRVSEFWEARFSFSHLNIDTEKKGFDVDSGSNTALDLLYFPYKKNLYFLAGANFLDVDDSNLSPGVGIGYRYYINQNAAFYVEGQGQYQLDDNYIDMVSKIGFVYFFGESSAPAPQPVKAVVKPAPVVQAEKDTDNDGVNDKFDQCPRTPAMDKVDEQGCTVFTTEQAKMELLVRFENDKHAIKPESYNKVKEAAEFLKKYPHVDLTINGHASAIGPEEYNRVLSQKRAQAVVDMLVENYGIAANRLRAVGHGFSQPIKQGTSAAAHAANRRIEAHVVVNKKRALMR